MTAFFYLGNGTILGVEVNKYGNVTEEWRIHESYETEMAGRSCVSEGEDNHYDLSRALRYTYRPEEWVGRPVSDLESRSRLERELEEEVWCVVVDNEAESLEAVLAPRWSVKCFGNAEYASEDEAKAAISRGDYNAHLEWALKMMQGLS